MRHWWVNQKQTHQHEVAGGYLWSPKRNRNGARNQFYENIRAVSPGTLSSHTGTGRSERLASPSPSATTDRGRQSSGRQGRRGPTTGIESALDTRLSNDQ